ncbi:MAG TPA: copper chaperone PCu(A)C [Burkholderiales bacterium]|jgi:copper(I)-binding protein
MRYLILLLLLATPPAFSQVQVEKPWARATAPGAKVAAGYMIVRNKAASADRLVSVTSPAAERVETHVTVRDGDIMRMRQVKGYDVPANGSLELKPGGAHLMFVDIRAPFREGERVPATLRFEKAGEVRVEFNVGRLTAQGHGH